MSAIKIAIVEDEVIIADTIYHTLEKLGYSCIEPCGTYGEALEMIEEESPDLVLLDIQLAGRLSGIDLAKKLKSDFQIPFIFLTSNSDKKTLDSAKQTNPNAYLLKPFNKADLHTSISIALHNHESQSLGRNDKNNPIESDHIFLKTDGKFIKVCFNDVLYLMSDHVYVEVHEASQKHLIRIKLDDLAVKFPVNFAQVHRRYVVNMSKISSISSNIVTINDIEIPLSKTHKDDFMNLINRI